MHPASMFVLAIAVGAALFLLAAVTTPAPRTTQDSADCINNGGQVITIDVDSEACLWPPGVDPG